MFSLFFSFYIWGFRVNRYNCIILLLFFMSFAFQNYCPYFKVAISSSVVDMPHAPWKEREGKAGGMYILTGGSIRESGAQR